MRCEPGNRIRPGHTTRPPPAPSPWAGPAKPQNSSPCRSPQSHLGPTQKPLTGEGLYEGPFIPTRDRSASLAATPRRPRHCPLTDGKGAASSSALCPEPTARGSLRPSCQTLFVAHGTQNPRKGTAATAKFEKNNKTTSTLKTGPTVLGEMADVQGWGRETTRGGWASPGARASGQEQRVVTGPPGQLRSERGKWTLLHRRVRRTNPR